MKFVKNYWLFIVIAFGFVFGLYSIVSFLTGISEERKLYRYDIVCKDNGVVIFEKRGQKRSFYYDGRWREVSIYNDDREHVKTIVMPDSALCETKHYKVYDE